MRRNFLYGFTARATSAARRQASTHLGGCDAAGPLGLTSDIEVICPRPRISSAATRTRVHADAVSKITIYGWSLGLQSRTMVTLVFRAI